MLWLLIIAELIIFLLLVLLGVFCTMFFQKLLNDLFKFVKLDFFQFYLGSHLQMSKLCQY